MRVPIPNCRTNRGGFTLIEILAAIVVFALGILALNRLQISTITTNTYSHQLAYAVNLAQEQVDTLMSLAYDDALLTDTNGDGTNQDTNSNGEDDYDTANPTTPRYFGLNKTGAQADHVLAPWVAPLATYTISWNVAVDEPLVNNKTIRVLVQWTDKRNILHSTSLDCIKSSSY